MGRRGLRMPSASSHPGIDQAIVCADEIRRAAPGTVGRHDKAPQRQAAQEVAKFLNSRSISETSLLFCDSKTVAVTLVQDALFAFATVNIPCV